MVQIDKMPPVLHARDNVASLLCVRHLHRTSRSRSSLRQHLQQQLADDAFQGSTLNWSLDYYQSCTNKSLSNLSHFFFQSMALYSWCSWMFAINVIIYVVSSSYFRQIYQIFLGDIIHGVRILWRNCCNSNKNNTTPPQVGESPVIELTHV